MQRLVTCLYPEGEEKHKTTPQMFFVLHTFLLKKNTTYTHRHTGVLSSVVCKQRHGPPQSLLGEHVKKQTHAGGLSQLALICELGKFHISRKRRGFIWPNAAAGLYNNCLFGHRWHSWYWCSIKVTQWCFILTLFLCLLIFLFISECRDDVEDCVEIYKWPAPFHY